MYSLTASFIMRLRLGTCKAPLPNHGTKIVYILNYKDYFKRYAILEKYFSHRSPQRLTIS